MKEEGRGKREEFCEGRRKREEIPTPTTTPTPLLPFIIFVYYFLI